MCVKNYIIYQKSPLRGSLFETCYLLSICSRCIVIIMYLTTLQDLLDTFEILASSDDILLCGLNLFLGILESCEV